jgi:hypothetical protein
LSYVRRYPKFLRLYTEKSSILNDKAVYDADISGATIWPFIPEKAQRLSIGPFILEKSILVDSKYGRLNFVGIEIVLLKLP